MSRMSKYVQNEKHIDGSTSTLHTRSTVQLSQLSGSPCLPGGARGGAVWVFTASTTSNNLFSGTDCQSAAILDTMLPLHTTEHDGQIELCSWRERMSTVEI